jgi:hypothetical protein
MDRYASSTEQAPDNSIDNPYRAEVDSYPGHRQFLESLQRLDD